MNKTILFVYLVIFGNNEAYRIEHTEATSSVEAFDMVMQGIKDIPEIVNLTDVKLIYRSDRD